MASISPMEIVPEMCTRKESVAIFLFFHLYIATSGLPIPKSTLELSQSDPLQSIVALSAACLFLGGQACSNNRIPIDATRQLDGKANLGSAQGLALPILKPIFGTEAISAFSGTDVSIGQPRVNTGNVLDILGVYKSQQGVRDAGIRGRGNYGASWGGQGSVLGDLVSYGNVNDVNFNVDRLRLDQQQKGGLRGFYEETFQTMVDPFSLKAGKFKETCYARLLFGGRGLCSLKDIGLAPGQI